MQQQFSIHSSGAILLNIELAPSTEDEAYHIVIIMATLE